VHDELLAYFYLQYLVLKNVINEHNRSHPNLLPPETLSTLSGGTTKANSASCNTRTSLGLADLERSKENLEQWN
jgi:hypothetical protein